MTRLMYAQSTRAKIEEQRTYLKSRFDNIQSHVQYATYLQGRWAQERVRVTVESVEGLRRDLEALQHIDKADKETVRAISQAVAERKTASGQKVDVFESVCSVAVSPDGKYFETAGQGTTVNAAIYGAAAGMRRRALKGHNSFVKAIAWSPDDSRLATCSHDKTAAVWDAASGERIALLEGHAWRVNAVAWSPDGRKLATASHDKTCVLWNVDSGGRLRVLEGHRNWLHSVAWSPDGRLVATGSEDRSAALWDVETGERLSVLEGHSEWVKCVAWGPDACMLATTLGDDTIVIWNVATGDRMHVLMGHTNWVNAVAWSTDGRVLATGSDDDTAALWNVSSGVCMHVLKGHTGLVTVLPGSPVGRTCTLHQRMEHLEYTVCEPFCNVSQRLARNSIEYEMVLTRPRTPMPRTLLM